MANFWKKLKKPFFALAPMSGVTDFPFREMISEIGKPDVIFTEFISTEGIVRNAKADHYKKQMRFSEKQRPVVVQFFGFNPERFEYCARLAVKLGFDGIDINMGCPDRKVQKQGAGSELIKNPELAKEIVRATIKGCGGKIPVSIKTRLGYHKKDIRYWIMDILGEGVSAVTIHGRTVKQGYGGEADWEEIGETSKEIRKRFKETVIIGNGDVKTLEQGKELAEKYGVDGVMIGRQVLHDPWVFFGKEDVSLKTRAKVALKHLRRFEKLYGPKKDFGLMKKYLRAYFVGTEFKKALMECKSIKEAKSFIQASQKSQCPNPNAH